MNTSPPKIELTDFKGLLSSLFRITDINFEVWGPEGQIFSSGSHRQGIPSFQELQDFSRGIMEGKTSQRASCHMQNGIFGVPLRRGEKTVASLIAYHTSSNRRSQPGDKSSSKTPLAKQMRAFLTHLASLIEDRWTTCDEMEEISLELAKSFESIYVHSKIATQIKTIQFTDAMLKDLTRELLENMGADLAFAGWSDRGEYNVLVTKPGTLKQTRDHNAFVASLVALIPDFAPSFEEGSFIVHDSRTIPEFRALNPSGFRLLAVNVHHEENSYGWLGLISFDLEAIFRRSDLRLLDSLAKHISVVIANKDLYSDLEEFVTNVVKSLIAAIEAKDQYTRGHSERVNQFCMLMAQRLGMDEKARGDLNWASTLHDIGKIGIPESILLKPAPLSDEEYGFVRKHPLKGCQILKPIRQLSNAMPAILHHHERYDGTGYPRGLKGEDIPLESRLIAVADTFDAITSERAYRNCKNSREALRVLDEVSGSQLDPALVQLFKKIYSTNLDLKEFSCLL